MGKPTGFMEYTREAAPYRDPAARLGDWNEFVQLPVVDDLARQGARCMDCGVPFCHTGGLMANMASGCPINNLNPVLQVSGPARRLQWSGRARPGWLVPISSTVPATA